MIKGGFLVSIDDIVREVLTPPANWQDTNEQAQMRACLIHALSGHDPLITMTISGELIAFIRDHLLAGAADLRRQAAKLAKEETGMTITDMAEASGQSRQAIARLITEARR